MSTVTERSLLGRLWFYARVGSAADGESEDDAESESHPEADGVAPGADETEVVGVATAVTEPPKRRRTRALENFTTEALAGALRSDPRPMLEVLAEHALCERPLPTVISVATQVVVPGNEKRHLDLVLGLRAGDGSTAHVWIEAKVHAPVSGDQLRVYAGASRALRANDGSPRHVVWLGPDSPPSRVSRHLDGVLRWQELADAATRVRAGWLWRDLNTFLKEHGMTEDRAYPISAREATILEDARRMFLKAEVVLSAVNSWARKTITEWPEGHWWKDGQVRGAVLGQLAASAELALFDGSDHPIYVRYGFAADRGEASLFVRVVLKHPGDQAVKARALAAVAPQLPGWERPDDPKIVLETSTRAVTVARQEDAEDWFKQRFQQLRTAGFFDFALRAGT